MGSVIENIELRGRKKHAEGNMKIIESQIHPPQKDHFARKHHLRDHAYYHDNMVQFPIVLAMKFAVF